MSAILLKIKMPFPWHFDVYIIIKNYRFHYPKWFTIWLLFKLFTQDHILARKQICFWQEIILVWLLIVILFIKPFLVFFKIFGEHVFSTKFKPSSKMIDSHVCLHTMPLKHPINLLFFTPHKTPVVAVCLLPLSIN